MTKENYTLMTNQELAKTILNIKSDTNGFYVFFKCRYPELLDELNSRTKFLEDYFNEKGILVPSRARIYCLEHNLTSHPTCNLQGCTNKVDWKNGTHCFAKYCCSEHGFKDPKRQELFKKTMMERHGVTNPSFSPEMNQKKATSIKRTMNEKYNVDNPSQIPEVKQKIKDTNMKRRGVTCSLQDPLIRQKAKETMIDRIGTDIPMKSELIKEKCRNTNQQTYGVDYPMQNSEVQAKRNQAMNERYNTTVPMQNETIRKRYEDTMMDKYKVKVPAKNPAILEKIKNTMIERHGVENYSQSKEFAKKCHKRYTNPKYPDMEFMNSWEFKVYDFLTENNISFEYQTEPIPYEYDGGIHYYHPDFKVGDRIVEVKGDNFFRINETTGKEEMYLTWKGDLSDEEYAWKCGKEEAKHQCMIANNVVILRKKEIDNLTIDIFK